MYIYILFFFFRDVTSFQSERLMSYIFLLEWPNMKYTYVNRSKKILLVVSSVSNRQSPLPHFFHRVALSPISSWNELRIELRADYNCHTEPDMNNVMNRVFRKKSRNDNATNINGPVTLYCTFSSIHFNKFVIETREKCGRSYLNARVCFFWSKSKRRVF